MSTKRLAAPLALQHRQPSALGAPEDILDRDLGDLALLDRLLLKSVALLGRSRVLGISGLAHVAPECDPFILVLNHSTRHEALLVPATLMLLRGGRRIHFLADWNFRMIPGVGLLYRRSGVITVPNKPARPRILNLLRPLLTDSIEPITAARRRLDEGRPVGIFPEAKVNPNPVSLLRGRLGASRLSLESGVAVVPAGLRFPTVRAGDAIPEGSPFELVIAPPMTPPRIAGAPSQDDVREWHRRIMSAIASASGKKLNRTTEESPHEGVQADAWPTG